MAARSVQLLLLLMTVWQASALSCNEYVPLPRATASPAVRIFNSSFSFCKSHCTRQGNCTAFQTNGTFGRFECFHIYQLNFTVRTSQNGAILYLRECSGAFTTTTQSPTFIPGFTTTPTTSSSSPQADDLGLPTGLVVLIACFSVIGGILLGMLLTIKCCPVSRDWFRGSNSSSGKDSSPSGTMSSVQQGCTGNMCSPSYNTSNMQGSNAWHAPRPSNMMPTPMVVQLPSYYVGTDRTTLPNTYNESYLVNGGYN